MRTSAARTCIHLGNAKSGNAPQGALRRARNDGGAGSHSGARTRARFVAFGQGRATCELVRGSALGARSATFGSRMPRRDGGARAGRFGPSRKTGQSRGRAWSGKATGGDLARGGGANQ